MLNVLSLPPLMRATTFMFGTTSLRDANIILWIDSSSLESASSHIDYTTSTWLLPVRKILTPLPTGRRLPSWFFLGWWLVAGHRGSLEPFPLSTLASCPCFWLLAFGGAGQIDFWPPAGPPPGASHLVAGTQVLGLDSIDVQLAENSAIYVSACHAHSHWRPRHSPRFRAYSWGLITILYNDVGNMADLTVALIVGSILDASFQPLTRTHLVSLYACHLYFIPHHNAERQGENECGSQSLPLAFRRFWLSGLRVC